MNNSLILVVTALSLGGVQAKAEDTSGADALFKTATHSSVSIQAPAGETVKVNSDVIVQEEIRLENPMARQLYSAWSTQVGLSYEYNSWVKKFFKNQFETFAHLKTAMAPQVDALPSEALRQATQAAHLYSLYRLDLPQTFVNAWLTSMENEGFAASKASVALDEAVAELHPMDTWILSHKVILSPAQEALVKKIGSARHANWLALNAMSFERKGILAEEFLTKLAPNSPFRPKLAMTVALAYARKGDLGNAAKMFKLYYEPWMNQSKDPKAVSNYTLNIARLLYQAGSVDGAIQYYAKIPKGSPDYITAREELAWSWLRQGNLGELRGNLQTLTSGMLSNQFHPESFLVKAISDLKLCFYSEVEKDFASFLKEHQPWAKKIEAGIDSADSLEPRMIDEYSQYAVDAIKAREHEIPMVQALAARSESAALPAVGPQKHWSEAASTLTANLEGAKKLRADEFRRQWRNDKFILVEAIRKMQFVKVELLSQVGDTKLSEKNVMPKAEETAAKKAISASGDQTFPFDGVMWPDELFKLRSVTQGQCVGQM